MVKKNLSLMLCAGFIFSIIAVKANATIYDTDEKNFPSLISGPANATLIKRTADSIFQVIGLNNYGLTKEVFFNAYSGLQYLQSKGLLKKTNILSICDFSQSSRNKRLYVIDLLSGRLLFNTHVAHGRNSGTEYATSFSNINSSNKSSIGFMVTAETYRGRAGLSLRFDGMEPGFNDGVRNRDIVMHGSSYVNEKVAEGQGYVGRSLGCPAVPFGQHTQIIEAIKDGSCFYIHHPDMYYAQTSPILNARYDVPLINVHPLLGQPAANNIQPLEMPVKKSGPVHVAAAGIN